MDSRQLKQNLQQQMERLLTQLADLQQSKETMEEEEYLEQYQDTVDQLEEFEASLRKMKDDSMLDAVARMQQAIREAFAQPRLHFAGQQPQLIRQQLTELERQKTLHKIQEEVYVRQKMDLLQHLLKLREVLLPEEGRFMERHGQTSLLQDFDGTGNRADVSSQKMRELSSSNGAL